MAIDAVLIGTRGTSATATVTTGSGTSTGGSGNHGLLFCSYDPGVTNNTPTDSKSNTWTLLGSVSTGGNCRMAIYRSLNWTGGASHTATMTFSGTAAPTLHLIEVTGAATSSPFDIDVVSFPTVAPFSQATGTLAQAGEVLIGFIEQNTNGTSTDQYTSTTMTILSSEPDLGNFWTSGVGKLVVASTSSTSQAANKGTTTGAISHAATFRVISVKDPTGAPPAAVVGEVGSTRNRPGRGPFSTGQFFVNRPEAFTSSVAVSSALTGGAVGSASGTAAPSNSKALTGSAVGSAAGTAKASLTLALSGNAAGSAVGSVAAATSVALTGGSAGSAPGSVGAGSDVTAALTGSAIGSSAGSAGSAVSVALVGSAAASAAGSVGTAASATLTGVVAGSASGAVLPASAPALTGSASSSAAGTVSASQASGAALTGIASSTVSGAVASSVTVTLTGASFDSAVGSVAVQSSDVTVALTGATSTAVAGNLSVFGTAVAAGHSRKVAIEHRGKLRLFESEEEAEEWLESLAPKQKKAVAKLVKKVVAQVATQNALQPLVFDAPRVVEGPPQIKALANMRAALLQGTLDKSIADRLAREQADRDDEEMVQALLFMMG